MPHNVWHFSSLRASLFRDICYHVGMSMLDGIKAKPDRVKSRIALLGAIVFTGAVAVVWTSTLPVRFGSLSQQIQEGIEGTATAKNALTDLVTEIQDTDTPDGMAHTEHTIESLPASGSALDKLGVERFDPTATTTATGTDEVLTTQPAPQELATSTVPSPSPYDDQVVKEATSTPLQPRPILIGTTTKPTP